jgi:hypothetical protein
MYVLFLVALGYLIGFKADVLPCFFEIIPKLNIISRNQREKSRKSRKTSFKKRKLNENPNKIKKKEEKGKQTGKNQKIL